ncbi:MAG TPA: type II toxin-antitoxin system VapC family toxin [Vicinamibacteria bacterium]|nr:type II toxin-antitoxin system VapC family toxin [Vicinamibacteria bacterium]
MKVLFDTSVLVAAMVEGHPEHDRALAWLERARRGALEFFVAAHSLAELCAVLSASWPARPSTSRSGIGPCRPGAGDRSASAARREPSKRHVRCFAADSGSGAALRE